MAYMGTMIVWPASTRIHLEAWIRQRRPAQYTASSNAWIRWNPFMLASKPDEVRLHKHCHLATLGIVISPTRHD